MTDIYLCSENNNTVICEGEKAFEQKIIIFNNTSHQSQLVSHFTTAPRINSLYNDLMTDDSIIFSTVIPTRFSARTRNLGNR